jgi:hypothetical protein
MTWYNRKEYLPPSDGVYEVGEEVPRENRIRSLGFVSYNGLNFDGYTISDFRVDYWRYPIVENVEKKYGKVKK